MSVSPPRVPNERAHPVGVQFVDTLENEVLARCITRDMRDPLSHASARWIAERVLRVYSKTPPGGQGLRTGLGIIV